MKIALLVQAHKGPEYIARMLEPVRAYADSIDVYLSIDLKSDLSAFRANIDDAVFIDKRVKIYWSNLSQIMGMLHSFDQILETKIAYDYVVFISGQDYFIKPVSHLISLLENNKGKEFIECREFGPSEVNWKVRYSKYHGTHLGKTKQTLLRVARQLPFPERKYPLYEMQYGGSAWVNLTLDAVRYCVEFCKKNPKFVQFHLHTHCPDEFFFQTILMHSPFRESIVNNNYRYIDWRNQKNNPKLLKVEDLDSFMPSEKIIARKFDPQVDSEVLDRIDNAIKNWSNPPLVYKH